VSEAGQNLAELTGMQACEAVGPVKKVNPDGIQEVVTDKGYHCAAVLQGLADNCGSCASVGTGSRHSLLGR
jgi:hypothetical protein